MLELGTTQRLDYLLRGEAKLSDVTFGMGGPASRPATSRCRVCG
jgi:hypothetical protein